MPGIGPRTAARLLERFGGLPALLDRIEELTGRDRERLRGYEDRLLFWRDLALLREDVPLAAGPRYGRLDFVGLEVLFRELELASLLPRLAALRAGEAGGGARAA